MDTTMDVNSFHPTTEIPQEITDSGSIVQMIDSKMRGTIMLSHAIMLYLLEEMSTCA